MKRGRTAPKSQPTKRAKYQKTYQKPYRQSIRKFDIEKKVNDTGPSQLSANTTGQFVLLMAPVPGSDITNRVGRKTLTHSIYIRGLISAELADQDGPTVGVSPAQLARIIIFIDNQPNGATPIVTDLLTSATSYAQLNLNNRDRFKILSDKQFPLHAYAYNTTSGTAVASLSNSYAFKKFIKCNIETIFNAGTAATIADITSGAIYMFLIGSIATGSNDATCALSTRVRYSDL